MPRTKPKKPKKFKERKLAITRTAKGTAKNKTSSTLLSISGVSVSAKSVLIVGIGFDSGNPPDRLLFDGKKMRRAGTVSGNGIAGRLYFFRPQGNRTGPIQAEWDGAAPVAKAMYATEWTEVGSKDVDEQQAQAATTSPSSGSGVTTTRPKEALIGLIVAEGPNSDAALTANNSWIIGQSDGTVGTPPVSNIKVTEMYRIVTATESAQASANAATSRDYLSLLVSFGRMPKELWCIQWVERGQCDDTCLEVMWSTPESPRVICSCGGSSIVDHILEGNAVALTDDAAFKTSVADNLGIADEEDLTVVKA